MQSNRAYSSIGPSFSLHLLRKMDLAFSSFIQSYQGIEHQEILTFNYEVTPTRAWGGRFVVHNGEVNCYLSYRNAGLAGTDTYVVLRNPNARRFASQILVKWVFSL